MNQQADNDRTAVYSAELAAFDGTDIEIVRGYDVMVSRIAAVTAGEWWPGPSIEVRRARADANSSSTRCSEDPRVEDPAVIRFATNQATIATAAHEMAHALAGLAVGHDPLFRRAYLDVVGVITNIDSTDRRRDLHTVQLAEAFSAQGLVLGERKWSSPPSLGPLAGC